MTTIGARLKAERTRLGFNQTDFAAFGGVGKLAQIKYEQGIHHPGADYLQGIAEAGADILLIVTGKVGNLGEPVSKDEAQWLEYFRAVPGIVRASVMASLRAATDYQRSEQLSRLKPKDQRTDND